MSDGAHLQFQQVAFQYETATVPLFEGASLFFPAGWTGVVGANGTGKTTLLRLAAELLEPTAGRILRSGTAVYGEQRTDEPPAAFADFLAESWGEALDLQLKLGVELDWLDRWETLSHGERKRAQVAVTLWQAPDVWALDEPSNHLDASARKMLFSAMRMFRGVGLVVSHDRELLDGVCTQCLFFEGGRLVIRPGGITAGVAQAERDAAGARHVLEQADRNVRKLEQESQRRRERAEQSMAKNTKRGIAVKDRDAKGRIDLGRLTGKDALGGKAQRQLAGRLTQAQETRSAMHVEPTYETGVWLGETMFSHRAFLFRVPAGELPLGEGRVLTYPEWEMTPRDRFAITGDNGGGKSSFLRKILPLANVEPAHLVVVPQEITLEESRRILAEVHALPPAEKGFLMTLVSRLGSRPQRLLESELPSPGEVRKILLARGIQRGAHLIVMDEPTNHMDLPGIRCLEDVLRGCPCGLLLVSHDRAFLDAVGVTEWRITNGTLCRV